MIGSFPSTQFPQGATFVSDEEMWVCDTTGVIWKKHPDSPDSTLVGNSGTGGLTGLAYHEKSKTLYGCSISNFYEIDMSDGSATLIGPLGAAGLFISIDCDQDGIMYGYDLNFASSNTYTIDLGTGHATILGNCGQSFNFGQDMAYDWDAEKMMATVFNYNSYQGELHEVNLDTGAFTYIATLKGGAQTTCFAIPGGGMGIDTYIAPGNKAITAIAENIGTFPETDMTAYAEIYEYITNCSSGTLVYEDNLTGIDILTPLTGTETLNFNSYDFVVEGVYGLMLELVDDDDDDLGNNEFVWGIGCDATDPTTTHALDPPNPDGLNDYYISDVEVTLTASDPSIGCEVEGSGIKEIKYQIDSEPIQTIPGDTGTFVIDTDSTLHTIRYWAIDNVGNTETEKTFDIKMDQTPPVIMLQYEVLSGNILQGWEMVFEAEATDATSGMERVEFDLNDVLQETVTGPGPLYTWSFTYHGGLKITIKAEGFDFAGLSAYAEVDPVVKTLIRNTVQNTQTQSSNTNVQLPLSR